MPPMKTPKSPRSPKSPRTSSSKTTKAARRKRAPKPANPGKAVQAAKPASTPTEVAPPLLAADLLMPASRRALDLERKPRTVIYVHGIGNKPEEVVLRCIWDTALFGHPMGDRTRMAYWVDRDRHGLPEPASCATADGTVGMRSLRALSADPFESGPRAFAVEALRADPRNDRRIAELAEGDAEAAAFLREVRDELRGPELGAALGAKGLGDILLDGVSWVFTRAFLGDVHDFFFDRPRRERMKQAVRNAISSGGGPFVVVAHSQGTMIAYDVLRELDAGGQTPIALFVTIGSPLGLPPVRARFKKFTKQKKLRVPDCVASWINVANEGDVVAFDRNLSDDIEASSRFENVVIHSPNEELAEDKHSASGYLRTEEVRGSVHATTGTAFVQRLGAQFIGADLVQRMEKQPRTQRHPVLIELVSRGGAGDGGDLSVGQIRDRLARRIGELVAEQAAAGSTDAIEDARIERLRYWLAARLNRWEIERLRHEHEGLAIQRIWRNAEKRTLINRSAAVVQSTPANEAYGAAGKGVTWAVLDTGIRADHPHFLLDGGELAVGARAGGTSKRAPVAEALLARRSRVKQVWDCTKPGKPPEDLLDRESLSAKQLRDLDPQGHGTHVAGIIAGRGTVLGPDGQVEAFAGMAPDATLIGFKVLAANGNGDDSWIIKALDKIAEINEEAGRLVIAGVNLSLGGWFDPSVYGCGHTPLCKELRRLWRQGVIVVLAAGNEGYAELSTASGEAWPTNLDLSIGDPANLEEAIAVGSVHRQNPHTYGISYFSSRGPTADGRYKPDLVAPGEKILSARHDWVDRKAPGASASRRKADGAVSGDLRGLDDLYVESSGTSMAAPHVSGLLAAFLGARPEFVGEPDRVKEILLRNCTDLGRDRYVQGHGVPNLVRMLVGT